MMKRCSSSRMITKHSPLTAALRNSVGQRSHSGQASFEASLSWVWPVSPGNILEWRWRWYSLYWRLCANITALFLGGFWDCQLHNFPVHVAVCSPSSWFVVMVFLSSASLFYSLYQLWGLRQQWEQWVQCWKRFCWLGYFCVEFQPAFLKKRHQRSQLMRRGSST